MRRITVILTLAVAFTLANAAFASVSTEGWTPGAVLERASEVLAPFAPIIPLPGPKPPPAPPTTTSPPSPTTSPPPPTTAPPPPSTSAPAAPGFRSLGPHGGGFQGVLAITPSGTTIAGADVSGVHRSTDAGATWIGSSHGLAPAGLKVAALLPHPRERGKIYLAAGWQGQTGGLYVSTDDGRSWQLRSGVPHFSGNNNTGIPGVPAPHPRSTGTLIAMNAAGTIWVATFRDGVMRSSDDGRTWTNLGLSGMFLRSLALDPANPDVLYVASYGNGIWKTTTARGAGSFARLSSSPQVAEELAMVDGELFVAAGREGVFRSRTGGSSWQRLGGDTLAAGQGTVWTAITGHGDVLYAGCLFPKPLAGGGYGNVFRSDDGGDTWRVLTSPAAVRDEIVGTSERWWVPTVLPGFSLDGRGYVAGQIVIDPNASDRVFVAGRSGVWRTDNGGQTWNPAVRGLGVTSIERVVVDPRDSRRLYAAATDYRLFRVDLETRAVMASPPQGSATAGLDVAVDGTAPRTTVYVATGNRDQNRDGEIYATDTPTRRETWRSLGLARVTGGQRPDAIAAGRDNGEAVVLAAVEGQGIWRRTGTTWRQVAGSDRFAGIGVRGAQFVWPAGSPTVYLYDNSIGLIVSTDAGRTWSVAWDQPAASKATRKGMLTVDPRDPSTILVSVMGAGVFRLRDGTTTRLGTFASPGPITISPSGMIVVTELGNESRTPRIYTSGDGGRFWADITDRTFASIGNPSDVVVTNSGAIVVATLNNGMLIRS